MKLVTAEKLVVQKVSAAPRKLSAWEKISAFKWLLFVQTLFLVLIFGGIAALFMAAPDSPAPAGNGLLNLMASSRWALPTLCVFAIALFSAVNVHWIVSQNIATVDEVEQSNLELAEQYLQ